MIKRKKNILLLLLLISVIFPVASYGFEDWQSDLDTENRGKLTVQQYDVYTLPYGNQGPYNSKTNWNNNVRAWQDRSIIFDSERLFSEPYYATAQISTKRQGRNLDIIFYNNRGNYGDASKQALKAWGYFVPQSTGYYKFMIESDDGAYAELYRSETDLNHNRSEATVLVNNMNVSFYNDGQSQVVHLEANKAYPIYLEYFNWGGDGLFTLKYVKGGDYNTVRNSKSFNFVGKDMLYPSKKDDFFKHHGSTSALIPVLKDAESFYDNYKGSSDPDIIALENHIKKCNKIIKEYYNYSQTEIDKAKEDLMNQMKVVEDVEAVVKQPYPDDLLIDEKGKITVQTYDVKNLKSVNEAGSLRKENVRNWTNENIVFNEDRKVGTPKLFTAETVKNNLNASLNDVFFYDGGGDYGYEAKEAREGWGYFVPNRTGYYDFKTSFDDGVKAYIFLNETDLKHEQNEGSKIVDTYSIGEKSEQSNSMYLEAGKPYPIYINHFNWHGPNRLLLQYRFSYNNSTLSGVFKDVPASWFYGSDKNDFYMIHGDKVALVNKISEIREILNNPNNLTPEQITRLENILDVADIMVDEYYNYLQVEFDNVVKSLNDVLKGSSETTEKIKKYIDSVKNREYIEVTDSFDEFTIDKNLWISSDYGRSKLEGGFLYADPRSKLKVSELFNDYDNIVVSVDQIYNGTVFKGGIGMTGKNGDIIQHLYNEYYREFYYGDDYGNSGLNGSNWFDIANNQNYRTKIEANKQLNGGYKVEMKIFNYDNDDNKDNDILLATVSYNDEDSIGDFLFNRIMLGTRRADGHVYAKPDLYSVFDNFYIIAYKDLSPLKLKINDFTAETIGDGIKLAWSADSTDFSYFEIREKINGQVTREFTNIPNTQREINNISIGDNQNDRVFEIVAKKGQRKSETVSVTWTNPIRNVKIENFQANTAENGTDIVLTWTKPNADITGYIVQEIKDGKVINTLTISDPNTTEVKLPVGTNFKDRQFRIIAVKDSLKSAPVDSTWTEGIKLIKITGMSAREEEGKIKISWTAPTDQGLKNFKLYETTNGSKTPISESIDGNLSSYLVDINKTTNRTFEVFATRNNIDSKPASCEWVDPISVYVPKNFTATTSTVDSKNIALNWDISSVPCDGYIIKEVVAGDLKDIAVIVGMSNNSYSVPTVKELGDRVFNLYIYKGTERKSKPIAATWIDSLNKVNIGSLTANTSSDRNSVVVSWTKPQGDFDNYELIEYINGVASEPIVVDKDSTSKSISLNKNQSDRRYELRAAKDGRKSNPASATWTNPLKDVKVGNFQANTAETGTDIVLTWTKPNSDITGYVIAEIVNGKEVEVKKINDPNTTTATIPNDNNLKDRKFIIYAVKDKFESLPVESIWDDGISLISINDFKGITEENHIKLSWNVKDQGVIDGFVLYETIGDRDVEIASNISKLTTDYTVPFNDSSSRVFKIRAYKGTKYSKWYSVTWKDVVSTTNKDKNKNDYVDLDKNTKVTTHDSNFGLAIEIIVGENPIYAPSLEFMIQGNEYLTYENPKLYLYDSKKKRISSKVVIEYDANAYAYKAQIIPIGLENNALATGTYYANLETKTIVNTDKYTQSALVKLYKENKVINNWELAYYIDDITDSKTGKKIIEGLGIQFDINFKPSPNGQVRKIESEDIKLELKSKVILPGGY